MYLDIQTGGTPPKECFLFGGGAQSVYVVRNIKIMWHTDPLLGNDRETRETTAIARQQLRK
jgi:hypothetical protein